MKKYQTKSLKREIKFRKFMLFVTVLAISYVIIDDSVKKTNEVISYQPILKAEAQEFSGSKTLKETVLGMIRDAGIDPYKAYAIVDCESRWNPEASHQNKDQNKTLDRGLWMINSYWHKEVSNSCAYDAICSTKQAIRIYKESGNNFSQWMCN